MQTFLHIYKFIIDNVNANWLWIYFFILIKICTDKIKISNDGYVRIWLYQVLLNI